MHLCEQQAWVGQNPGSVRQQSVKIYTLTVCFPGAVKWNTIHLLQTLLCLQVL